MISKVKYNSWSRECVEESEDCGAKYIWALSGKTHEYKGVYIIFVINYVIFYF